MDKNSEATSYEITFSANYDDALDGFGYLQTVAPAEPAALRSTKKAATSAA
jgi:hypothetical protein